VCCVRMARVLCEHGPCAVWAWPVCCVSMARVLCEHGPCAV
jgi:hypothetical protein